MGALRHGEGTLASKKQEWGRRGRSKNDRVKVNGGKRGRRVG